MSKNRPTPVAPTRKQLSRAQRDRQLRNYIRIAAAVVAVLVVGILAFGVVDQTVLQPNRPVASVNGVNIATVNFEKHVRYTRMQAIQQYWQMQQYAQYFGAGQFSAQMTQAVTDLSSPTTMGQKTLDQMVSDEIVRQEAKKRNITLNPAEVDQQIQQAFFFYPNGTPTPGPTSTPAPTDTPVPTRVNQPTETPTPVPSNTPSDTPTGTSTPGPTPTNTPSPTITPTSTPYTQSLFNRDWKDAQARIEAASGLSSADIRAIFETSLYRTKLTAIWDATPETGSVHARHILVSSQVTATQIISQLQAGADFATLAAQYSEDTSTKDSGGDLGFFTKGQMQPEFEAAAFSAPVGLITTPVQTVYGWHVIEVLGTKLETQDEARTRAFTDWLTKEAADPTVVTRYDSWWQAHIPTDPVLNTAVPPTPFPTSQP